MSDTGARCERWLLAFLDLFHPDRATRLDPVAQAFPPARLVELLLVLRLSPARHHRLRRRASAMAAHAWRALDVSSSDIADHLLPHVVLFAALLPDGVLQPVEVEWIRRWTASVRVPDQHLQLAYALQSLGLPSTVGEPVELTAASSLACLANPATFSRKQAYRLTHDLLYADLLGTLGSLPDAVLDRLVTSLDVLALTARRARDFDLGSELLWCLDRLGRPDVHLHGALWALVERAQQPDGAVPGPHHREGSSAEERWATDAHTTLVALLRSQTADALPADLGHAESAEAAASRVRRVRAVANGAGWPLDQGVAA